MNRSSMLTVLFFAAVLGSMIISAIAYHVSHGTRYSTYPPKEMYASNITCGQTNPK